MASQLRKFSCSEHFFFIRWNKRINQWMTEVAFSHSAEAKGRMMIIFKLLSICLNSVLFTDLILILLIIFIFDKTMWKS